MLKYLSWVDKLNVILARRVELSGNLITLYGIFFVINYVTALFVMPLYYKTHHDPYYISELICLFVSFVLALNKKLPLKTQYYIPALYYIAALYMLAVMGTYVFLAETIAALKIVNILQAIFILTLLFDWVSFFIITTLGIGIEIIVFRIIHPSGSLNIKSDFWFIFSILWTIYIGLFFSRKISQFREKQRLREQLEAMKSGGFIAHELRTPLRIIHSYMTGIEHSLPALLKAYDYAQQHNPQEFTMSSDRLALLGGAMNNIQKEADLAFSTIDLLLVKINQESKIDPSHYDSVHIKDVITETVQRYPFVQNEHELVHWQADASPDFTFHGDHILTTHILFNLLRNALYQSKVANKGDIFISTKIDTKFNYVIVKDTSTGIAKESLPHIFEHTFSTSARGVGLGLNFCKSVMESYGGKISCESILGGYTDFILRFPKQTRPVGNGVSPR